MEDGAVLAGFVLAQKFANIEMKFTRKPTTFYTIKLLRIAN